MRPTLSRIGRSETIFLATQSRGKTEGNTGSRHLAPGPRKTSRQCRHRHQTGMSDVGGGLPQTSLRVRANWDSGANAGWQQRKISGRESSAALSVADHSRSLCDSSHGNLSRNRASRRTTSRDRCFAAVIIQATGVCGIPSRAHLVSAAAKASCAQSSATSTSPETRRAAARTRATTSAISAGSVTAGLSPERAVSPTRLLGEESDFAARWPMPHPSWPPQ